MPDPFAQLPVACTKWYDFCKWVLDRVEAFPKNQRFVLGTRVADAALEVMEELSQAAYAKGSEKLGHLDQANTRIASLRWLLRICKDRNLLSNRQFAHACTHLEECGRMVGGWRKQASGRQA